MVNLVRIISSSLRAKLLTMFVVLTFIPLITVGLISYQKSFNTISGHSKASTLLVADQLARDIDVLFQDTGKLLELEKNPQVLRFLFSQSETYEDAKEILRTFDLYREIYRYENVLNITMINLYGKGISERKGVFQLDHNPLRNPHFQKLLEEPEKVLNIPPSGNSALDRLDGFDYPHTNVISIMATVKQRITHEVIGFMVIDLDDSIVERFCNDVTIGRTGFFYVSDQAGNPIFAPSMRNASNASREAPPLIDLSPSHIAEDRDSFVQATEGKPRFVVYSTSRFTGWKIIGSAPLQEIVEDANKIRQLIFVSVGFSIIFAISLYFFITSRLTRPIQVLKNKMRQAETGYWDAKVKPSGRDEIADLGSSFNIMLEKIKGLLDQSIKEQEQIQKAELRTLQAQINPHFLYNTLDSIVWMAEAGKNEQVIKIVQAFSRFFRLSLNKGRDWISIQSELDHVRSYLVIQQMRYRDILDYKIEVEPELVTYAILGMTLQPLVENALYHGIKNKRGKGMIRITGHTENGQDIVLVVEDNGIGMSELLITELRANLGKSRDHSEDSEDQRRAYGLHNVHQRLQLYFGPRYGVEIVSRPGEGTRVSIRIPRT
ncbi:sensor histidine kinase [Cohnella lupini]|uniref:Two-component system sensor histidine kinase YesM n=1 Tax=Cohnella lupini TaxID=1294267 RepID=A0A3D9HZI6_9BACL|nr:sensor histidine kinase [Cohnella lupini]RED54932.1 two-component system sensor histidine kinase YesM [Cohnella lupini]